MDGVLAPVARTSPHVGGHHRCYHRSVEGSTGRHPQGARGIRNSVRPPSRTNQAPTLGASSTCDRGGRQVTRRRKLIHDLSDSVADRDIRERLAHAVYEMAGQLPAYYLLFDPRQLYRDANPSTEAQERRLLGGYLSVAWAVPEYRAALVAYTEKDPEEGRCRGCNIELQPRQTRERGRPREHCSNGCRQRAYRNCKRIAARELARPPWASTRRRRSTAVPPPS